MRMTRRGFTMMELALTLVVVAILTTMAIARIGTTISRSKVDRAASVVAADLENAFSTGGRLRQPLVFQCDCPNKTYRLNDQLNGGALRFQRNFGPDSPFSLDSIVLAPATMTILPPGRVAATSLPFLVTLYSGDKVRQVSMTSAGFVRITTP